MYKVAQFTRNSPASLPWFIANNMCYFEKRGWLGGPGASRLGQEDALPAAGDAASPAAAVATAAPAAEQPNSVLDGGPAAEAKKPEADTP